MREVYRRLTYPKPNTKTIHELRHYTGYDVEISYRSDHSMLYRSPRIPHWFIIETSIPEEDADAAAIAHIEGAHSTQTATLMNAISEINVITHDQSNYKLVPSWQ